MKKEHFVAEIQLKYVPKNKRVTSLGRIVTSPEAYSFVFELFNPDTIRLQEEFLAVYLNYGCEVIGYHFHSKGSVSGTVVDIKLIAATALKSACSNVVICHNHPSGNIKPSRGDKDITQELKQALGYFNIKLLDHIVISPNGPSYYSFADQGLL